MTARAAWGLDEDMPHLQRALDDIGVAWEEVAWDDEGVEWSKYSLVVLRSAWDYHMRLDEFLDWVDRVAGCTMLANSRPIVRWNVDKHYLLEAAGIGLPIVPTMFIEPGESDPVAVVRDVLTRGDVVIKPAISAGSNDTERHGSLTSATGHLSALLEAGRSVMVQPYLSDVETQDETGLVYLAGEFSHAFAKGPLLAMPKDVAGDLFARERIEARTPSADERAIGDAAVAWLTEKFGTPLYARIDLLPTVDGPVIIELELTEPSLFLHTHPSAPSNAARSVAELSRR